LKSKVFYKTKLSYALVNHKPLQPGHVLIIPFRLVPRLTDLTPNEVTDLFLTVQKVQKMLASLYFTTSSPSSGTTTTNSTSSAPNYSSISQALENGSFNVALQDGIDAGQTVPHVHVHIIPRVKGNEEGDGIYQRLQSEDGNVGGAQWDLEVRRRPPASKPFVQVEESSRQVRSDEVMNEEARLYAARMRDLDGEEESESQRQNGF